MDFYNNKIKIFSGNSNEDLANLIVKNLNLEKGKCSVEKFSDGEISVSIKESVRGCDCFVVQSTSHPVNTNLMELLILIDALKRASAGRITAVIPYFGYARQDRKTKARDPISARLCANIITTAGADRVLTMDLHAPQIQGFFNIPLDHLIGIPVLMEYFKNMFKETKEELVIVAPDLGSVTIARNLAEKLDASIAIVEKRRQKANVSEVLNIIGDVKNKTVIMADDMIDTAGTLCNASKALVEIGKAKKIYACATHGILSGPAIERIKNSAIEQLIVTDTVKLSNSEKLEKIKTVTVSNTFSKAIEKIHNNESVSSLFAWVLTMKIFELFKKIQNKNQNNSKISKLIVGLGNPFPKYNNTRHNAGFEAIDHLAKTHNIEIKKQKFSSLFGDGIISNVRCLLLKPLTFMNNSGFAVEDFKNYYKLEIEDVIVLFDDISFSPGKIKIKKKGSSGGHNGVKSIIEQTGEENFIRIKIGVGEKPNKNYDLSKWVLARFSEEEKKLMQEGFKKTTAALELILNGEIEKAMNKFN